MVDIFTLMKFYPDVPGAILHRSTMTAMRSCSSPAGTANGIRLTPNMAACTIRLTR